MEIKCLPLGDFGANCYLVKTNFAALVIDPFSADQRVLGFLNENSGLEKYVLLTHFHFDHILGANEIRKQTGAKIVIGEKDAIGLIDPTLSLSAMVGVKQELFTPDITLADNQTLNLKDTYITALHTPGHTEGSVCYILENVMFSGDTLFKQSIGRTDFPTGSAANMKASLNRLKGLEKDYIIYSGHGEATTLFAEIKNNPYLF